MQYLRPLFAASLLAYGVLAQAAPAYNIKLMSTSYMDPSIGGINNHGNVVAFAGTESGWSGGIVYNPATGLTSGMADSDTGVPHPRAINDQGKIAVTLQSYDNPYAATYDPVSGTYTRLAYEWMRQRSRAEGINNAGTVVGSSGAVVDGIDYQVQRATIWANGKATVFGGNFSSAQDINDTGVVVGYAQAGQAAPAQAFLYDGTGMTSLGTLGGDFSAAYAVNSSNTVVGDSNLTSGSLQSAAFIYHQGVMTDLGAGLGSTALDINDSGTVVGNAQGGGFIYANGQVSLLDQLIDPASGWHVKEAGAINNLGQIGATVCDTSNVCVGAILNPVPEPATYGMLLGGLGVVGLVARRRRADSTVS